MFTEPKVVDQGGVLETPSRGRTIRVDAVLGAIPAGVLMAFLLVAPIGVFFAYSFLSAGLFSVGRPFTLENYTRVFSNATNHHLAWNSFTVGVLTAGATVIVGLPCAYWLRFAAQRTRRVVIFLIIASMLASYLVRIYAWRTILGRDGLLNRGLEQLGVIHDPLGFLIFSRLAVVVALVHIFLPVVTLVLFAGFASISPTLLEAAADLGASAPRRWMKVVLPLMARPTAAAFVFVYIVAASDYVTPQFLGGVSGSMLGVQVQANFLRIGNWAQGAAIAFLMLGSFAASFAVVMAMLRVAPAWARAMKP